MSCQPQADDAAGTSARVHTHPALFQTVKRSRRVIQAQKLSHRQAVKDKQHERSLPESAQSQQDDEQMLRPNLEVVVSAEREGKQGQTHTDDIAFSDPFRFHTGFLSNVP